MNMKTKIIGCLCVALLFSCVFIKGETAVAQEDIQLNNICDRTDIDKLLNSMTLEEKIAQLFFITPEALTGVATVTEAGDLTEECYKQYPVGGIIYFRENIESRQQLSSMLRRMQEISTERIGLPAFLGTDEEGGRVTRIYGSSITDIPYVGSMYSVGTSGDLQAAYEAGNTLGCYLKELGFNVDFAPVADIFTNEENTVIGDRAFGNNVETVSEMVPACVKGLQDAGIEATLKHFPGHGDTTEDSHSGYANSYKNLDELRECELKPFQAGIKADVSLVMVGHISLPDVLDSQTPASLSSEIVQNLLRDELDFKGVIITDALNMGAISQNYTSADAAISAVKAGVDMLLMPLDFRAAYEALINAVQEGEISEQRINESVRRIIRIKEKML